MVPFDKYVPKKKKVMSNGPGEPFSWVTLSLNAAEKEQKGWLWLLVVCRSLQPEDPTHAVNSSRPAHIINQKGGG